MKKILAITFLSVLTVIIACKKNDKGESNDTFNRQAILINMADSLIIPSYQDFQVKADAMMTKVKAFTDAPTPNSLAEARAAWLNAYISWQKVALWNFGPAMDQVILPNANTYPANVTAIEQAAAGGNHDLNSPFSRDIQGFPAIEYLLYGDNATDLEIIASFTSATKKTYINALTKKISDLNKAVVNAWTGAYRQTFINASGLDRGSSLGELFNNTFLPYLEMHNREAKFGIPGGQRTGTPLPGNVEGRYSKVNSKALALAAFNAYKNAWYGTGFSTGQSGSSVFNYLRFMDMKNGSTIHSKLHNQFAAIEGKINAQGPNFYTIASSEPAKLNEVWLAYQQFVVTVKTEVASALSVTISYTDTDGD
jgi:predicted lipoprotein